MLNTPPVFSLTGETRNHYYLLNESPVFAIIPRNKIKGIDQDMPIHLPYGNTTYGAQHILASHGKWVLDQEPSGCVATLVWKKLNQNGDIYIENKGKITLSLKLAPSSLLILKEQQGFLSITTMYGYDRTPHGQLIRKYMGRNWGIKS